MGGPDKDARFNDIFEVGTKRSSSSSGSEMWVQVELDPDGVVSYWKKDKEVGGHRSCAVLWSWRGGPNSG